MNDETKKIISLYGGKPFAVLGPIMTGKVLDGRELIEYLEYPRDKHFIASLSLEEKQEWYSNLMRGGLHSINGVINDVDFQRFWSKTYLRPVKWKRRWFKVKRFFTR